MVDPRDREPANHGEGADTVVYLEDGSRLLGLRILGVTGYPMLGIRVDADGRPVSVARDEVAPMHAPAQSNPRCWADPPTGDEQ